MFEKLRLSYLWFSSRVVGIVSFCFKGQPVGDCFWLLDVLLLLAVFQLYASLSTKFDDTSLVVFDMVKVAVTLLSGMRILSIVLLREPIASLRNFVTSNRLNSGDAVFDELERRRFNKFSRAALLVIYGATVLDTILLSVPNSSKDSVLELPPQLVSTGKYASNTLYFLFVGLLALSIVPKMFSALSCSQVLLVGMRWKFKMLVHRYETIANLRLLDVDDYYERIECKVLEAVEQQLEFWSYLQILKDLVAKQFFLVHYFSVGAIGSMLYVSRDIGLNILSVAVFASTLVLMLEYFLWCHLVDSFEDVADSVGSRIFELCAKIPYSPKYRTRYRKLQTSLMITWIVARNGVSMNCMGLFKISTIAFVGFVNTAYSVLMFLINMH
ncbi:uncharacterized protein LOC5578227 isoform X2 [Aedes aegypti]|uniref:Uncharacterized protein n=1 Tax=Aedes aegypti TaxID=7159 RepID=A0A6I8TP23_AEDAE|nr:uncharacterized protein LOC5578227 isoform X2 [Aedes aegypti]